MRRFFKKTRPHNPYFHYVFFVMGVIFLSLLTAGCNLGDQPDAENKTQTLSYTYDEQLGILIEDIKGNNGNENDSELFALKDFHDQYTAMTVPEVELSREPYVLALATRSRVPALLLLDSPWVQGYGQSGWLEDLSDTTTPGSSELPFGQIPDSLREAFSIKTESKTTVLAMPRSIKGNLLFYRKDLLKKYCGRETPPQTWDELKKMAQKVLEGQNCNGQKYPIKYGLIFHTAAIHNDFYPILWGFGDNDYENGKPPQINNRDKAVEALKMLVEIGKTEVCGGTIGVPAGDIEKFNKPRSLRESFFYGEALFMINWNTRYNDLKDMIEKGESSTDKTGERLYDIKTQVGWTPIPRDKMHDHRYVNIGSFGWSINSEAMKDERKDEQTGEQTGEKSRREAAYRFLALIFSKKFQSGAAEKFGLVPSRKDVIEELRNNPKTSVVVSMFDEFTSGDVELKARPFRREINAIVDDNVIKAISGEISPEEAVDAGIKQIRENL